MKQITTMNIRFWMRQIIWMLGILSLFACAGDTQVRNRLAEARALMNQAPDSALVLLDSIDVQGMRESDRMMWNLLRCNCLFKTDVPFTTDSLMIQVADYFDHHGTPNDKLLAHYVLGSVYRDMGAYPRAIEQYCEATEKADTTAADCDLPTLMRVYSQIGKIYELLVLPTYEETANQKAKDLCAKIKDTVSWKIFDQKSCIILAASKKYADCIKLTKQFYRNYLSEGDSLFASTICVNIANSYYALAQYDSAKVYIDIYAQAFENPSLNLHNIVGGDAELYILRGKYYLSTGKPDSALVNFRQAFSSRFMYPLKAEETAYGIAKSYKLLHNPDSALKYIEVYDSINGKVHDEAAAQASMTARDFYDYTVEQKIAQRKSDEAANAKAWLQWALLLILLLIVLVIILKYKQLSARKKIIELQFKHQQAINDLHTYESQLNILSIQKRETEEILSNETQKSDFYRNELSNISGDIATKTLEIEAMRKQIESLEKLIASDNLTNANELFWQSEIVGQFRKAFSSRGYSISQDQWMQLHRMINKLFPEFEKTISSNGKLSITDMQVCMLVKANFSPSEIDYLMQMRHSYASNARKRLHTTIFGYPGSGTDFDKKILYIK